MPPTDQPATIAEDGRQLYFASDRPVQFGRLDIYVFYPEGQHNDLDRKSGGLSAGQ